ncbi:MAG: flagellar hook-associated protein FlgK [Alphaproteobacteria bacterium]|nr:flagellar hook-associated protein FlgK [Alphaproteobacteria bacterium]
MSLLSAIDNAKSSMRIIQTEMQVISSNVSSAGVDGYTKKRLLTSAIASGPDGTGGVKIDGYSRATSTTIDTLLKQAMSDAGLRGAQSDYLSRVQDLMGSSQSNPALSKAITDFSTAWNSYAAAPEDSTNKQNILYTAQNLTREVTRLATGLDKIKADVNADVGASVTSLNGSLQRIYSLNNEISTAEATGQDSGSLQDMRDKEVQNISSMLKITVVQRPGNRIAIFTPAGSSLLDSDPKQFVWNGTTITQNGADVTSAMVGGKLEGLIGLLDQGSSGATLNDPGKATFYKIGEQLNKIVDLFTNAAGTFATAYNSATTGSGELASSFFTGTDRYTFVLNTALATGSSTLKVAAAIGVAADLNLENRSVSAGNLSTSNVSYAGFTNAMVGAQNQNAKQISDLATIYTSQKDDYSKRLKDETGVNIDEEIVMLTQLQNNYSASARVITTVKQLFDILNSIF